MPLSVTQVKDKNFTDVFQLNGVLEIWPSTPKATSSAIFHSSSILNKSVLYLCPLTSENTKLLQL